MGTHTLAQGKALGRYELLLPIAQGGMATVWAARQRGSRGFSKTVAIKTILPNLSDDPTFEQMFLDEASIASRIHHPNVAEIFDLGEEDEILYLVMEWVDGESLSTLAKQAKRNDDELPVRVSLRIVAQALAGLHAAHELRDDDDRLLQLVHRDVSPQNILVTSSGVAKLVDFGVAKALGRSGQTSVGQLKGKVPFMSPEQARGNDIDRRTDLFAMGVILYRLVTGAHPFMDETDVKTMRNIVTRPAIPPRTRKPNVAAEVERVILKALHKDPELRYQTAAEMAAEVEGAMSAVGGTVPVEEVATFVKATLGERDRKRRAAIRDAVLKLDEAATAAAAISADGMHTRDSVSSLVLTKTGTPPGVLDPEGAAEDGDVTVVRSESDPRLPLLRSEPPHPTSPTVTAMAASKKHGGARRVRLAAIGAGAGVVALGIVALVDPFGAGDRGGAPAAGAGSATAGASTAAPSAAPSEPFGTTLDLGALPAASAGAAPSASAPSADASAAAAPPRAGLTAPSKPATAAPKTSAVVAPSAQAPTAPPPTTTATSGPRVPTVQDPGF